jgi:hypothetical protein
MKIKSRLEKWANGKWLKDPANGSAYSSEIVYAIGNEDIDASAGVDACRLIVFYDSSKQKAAILHSACDDGEEYRRMLDAIRSKKFRNSTTTVFLCGDGKENYTEWNDEIETAIVELGYVVTRISKGKGKNVSVNPANDDLTITDHADRNLLTD